MTRASGKTPKGKTGRPDRDIKNWINCSRAWTGQETQIQRMGSAGFWNKAWKEHTHKDRPVNLSFDQRKNDISLLPLPYPNDHMLEDLRLLFPGDPISLDRLTAFGHFFHG